MPFEKGKPKTGGRKKGVMNKDTRNYLDLQAFAKLIWDGMEEAGYTGKDKIELGFRGIMLMFQKIQNLPGSPTQSVENVEKMIEAYEKEKAPLNNVIS